MKLRSILPCRRLDAISLLSIMLIWSATKVTAQTDKEGLLDKDNQEGLSGEANAVIFGVFVLAVCGSVYLCISWTCCFEHEMIHSDDHGCCPSDTLRQLNSEINENNTVHLTENMVDVVWREKKLAQNLRPLYLVKLHESYEKLIWVRGLFALIADNSTSRYWFSFSF